jgi:hypothetical protein
MVARSSLRSMPLEAMADVFRAADDVTCRAILAETRRRDSADQSKRARAAQRQAWESAAHAQYLQADEVCRGNLVNRRGCAARVTDWSLWSGPASRALRYATEELREFWYTHPRVTVEAYRRQLRDARRIDQDVADLEAMGPAVESVNGGTVRRTSVVAGGRDVPAWWAVSAKGAASLHFDRGRAVAAV